ncbi:MAG TPA: PhzF family phenazine biosynthesis protein [Bryobacteraceae bacterium]|nr:PhzF family phenazine biosynthesis protein [Bryobacteraceae bacterium]
MSSYRYRVVDVFTEHALEGNPLAVFPDASGMDDATMQKIAKEMNLSETTFVLPPTRPNCLARVRIFTPTREMVFAGHPTIGTSFVLLDEKAAPANSERFNLDEKVGPVPIRVEHGARPRIWLTTPPIQWGKSFDRSMCARALGLDAGDLLDLAPQLVSAGNPNVFIALKDKNAVDRSWLDAAGLAQIKEPGQDAICIFVFTPTPDGAYSRMFAPEHGVMEDPATGSATGPLAAYMMRNNLASKAAGARFLSEQGTKMGRRSILYIQVNGAAGVDGIEVGGYVTPLVNASMAL